MARTRWFEEKLFTGHSHCATVETTMLGNWRVVTENIAVGGSVTKLFKGRDARKRAIEWAQLVLIPPVTPDML